MSHAMAIGKAGNGDEPFGAAPHERPVPRISISAFCEFPDSGAALQRASADRRLAKAHVDVQLGGVQAAIDHFTGQVTPNLLIVETKLQGKAALEDVDRLAEVCDPATKVVVTAPIPGVRTPTLPSAGAIRTFSFCDIPNPSTEARLLRRAARFGARAACGFVRMRDRDAGDRAAR